MGNDNFYIYILLDQRVCGEWVYQDTIFKYKPFYVGIGVDYRMTAHFTPFNLRKRNIKNNIIKSIMNGLNELPIHYKIYEGLTSSLAKELEIDIIKHFGKIKDNSGILANLTDGGDGITGYNHSTEYKNSLKKKVYQYDLNGMYIKEWDSLKSVIENYQLSGGNAIRVAIKRGIKCKNFLWSFKKLKSLPKYRGKNPPKYLFGIIINNKEKFFTSKNEIDLFFKKNVSMGNISSCCNGKLKTYLGYKWIKKNTRKH